MISQNQNYEQARKICISQCDNTNFPNECKTNCETDYNAVEKYSNDKRQTYNTTPPSAKVQLVPDDNTEKIFLVLMIVALLLAFFRK